MNICFYTDQTISGMTGGIGRITSVLADYFKNKFGWKIYSIYANDARKDCIITEVDDMIKLRLHDRFNIKPEVKANYSKAVDFISRNNIDVVIIQTSLDVVSKLRIALDQTGVKHVKLLSVLHFEPGKDEWPWQGSGIKGLAAWVHNKYIHHATVKIYRSAYLHGDKVVLLSNNYIKEYKQYANLKETSKLLAIPNCLSFRYTISDQELKSKKKIALVVARMADTQKRISLILKMWKEIESLNLGWKLQLVGEGPSLDAYKQIAKKLDLRYVCFEGRQDPVPYYRNASLFLMTSSFEGFPMTLVEAAQFGCVPVVYDSFSSLSDVVIDKENGFVVSEGDEKAFIEKVKQLMNDQELTETMAKTAISYCQKFSQETICNNWRDLIASL